MHNRLYKFLNDNSIIYLLQFGFRQKKGKYSCRIFVDLQKAFDTVDNILIGKLKHYGTRGVAYSWFESYLKGRKQHASINEFNSKDLSTSYGVPQGSVFGPLLFLLYINDLHNAIKFCKVHYFADDINLLHISKSIKKLNKFVNFDLKILSNWLNANKISLNISKTELITFKPRIKTVDFDLKLELNAKRLDPTKSVKYLGITIDESLTWNEYITDIAIKLNRANAMLYKVREFENTRVLKLIYLATSDCHLNYANTVGSKQKFTKSLILITEGSPQNY